MYDRYEYKDIISRMNATAIRFKNTHPEITKIYRRDMAWLKTLKDKNESI
jgi:hypothetical protein